MCFLKFMLWKAKIWSQWQQHICKSRRSRTFFHGSVEEEICFWKNLKFFVKFLKNKLKFYFQSFFINGFTKNKKKILEVIFTENMYVFLKHGVYKILVTVAAAHLQNITKAVEVGLSLMDLRKLGRGATVTRLVRLYIICGGPNSFNSVTP